MLGVVVVNKPGERKKIRPSQCEIYTHEVLEIYNLVIPKEDISLLKKITNV